MDSTDLARLKAAKVMDARWAPCPLPLLQAKEGIGQVRTGEVLEIRSHDPGAPGDISAWAGKAGHEFLGFLDSAGYDRIFVRKKSR